MLQNNTQELRRALLAALPPAFEERHRHAVAHACDLAEQAHKKQTRDDNRTPYITHPLRVALRLAEDLSKPQSDKALEPVDIQADIIAAALLHDLLEDSQSYAATEEWTRVSQAVKQYVSQLTRSEEMDKSKYLAQIAGCPLPVKVIKFSDKLDNLLSLSESPTEGKAAKLLSELEHYMLPMAEQSDSCLLKQYAFEMARVLREDHSDLSFGAAVVVWTILGLGDSRLAEWLIDLKGFLECTSRTNILTADARLVDLLLILCAAAEKTDPHSKTFSAKHRKRLTALVSAARITQDQRLALLQRHLPQKPVVLSEHLRIRVTAALENFCFQLCFEEETLALEELLEVLETCLSGGRTQIPSRLDAVCDAASNYLTFGRGGSVRERTQYALILPRQVPLHPNVNYTRRALSGEVAAHVSRLRRGTEAQGLRAEGVFPIAAYRKESGAWERIVFGYLVALEDTRTDGSAATRERSQFVASLLGEFIASDVIKVGRLLGFMIDRRILFETRCTYATLEEAARLHYMWRCDRERTRSGGLPGGTTINEDERLTALDFLAAVCGEGPSTAAGSIVDEVNSLLKATGGSFRTQFELPDLTTVENLAQASVDNEPPEDVFSHLLLHVSSGVAASVSHSAAGEHDDVAKLIANALEAESCGVFWETTVGIARDRDSVGCPWPSLRAMIERGSYGALSKFREVGYEYGRRSRPMNYFFLRTPSSGGKSQVTEICCDYGMCDEERDANHQEVYDFAGRPFWLNKFLNAESAGNVEVCKYTDKTLSEPVSVQTRRAGVESMAEHDLPTTLQICATGLPRLANTPAAMDSLSNDRLRRGKVDRYNYPLTTSHDANAQLCEGLRKWLHNESLAAWYDFHPSAEVPLRERVLRSFMAVPILRRVGVFSEDGEQNQGLEVAGIIKVENRRPAKDDGSLQRLERDLRELVISNSTGSDGHASAGETVNRQSLQDLVGRFNVGSGGLFRRHEARRLAQISSCFRVGDYFRILRRLPRPTVSGVDVSALRSPEAFVDGYLAKRGNRDDPGSLENMAGALSRLLKELQVRMQFHRAVGLLKNEGAAAVLDEEVMTIYGVRVKDLDSLVRKIRRQLDQPWERREKLTTSTTVVDGAEQEREYIRCSRRLSPFWAVIKRHKVDDLVGARVVTGYLEDLEMVLDVLLDMLGGSVCTECADRCWSVDRCDCWTECRGRIAKIDRADGEKGGYRGVHVTVYLPCRGVRDGHPLEGGDPGPSCFPVEVQVRTENQHTWARKSHHLVYKEEALIKASAPMLLDELRLLSNMLHNGDRMSDIVRHNVLQHVLGDYYVEWELRRRLRDLFATSDSDRQMVLRALGFLKGRMRHARNDIGFSVVQHSIEVCLVLLGELGCRCADILTASLLHEAATITELRSNLAVARVTGLAGDRFRPVQALLDKLEMLYTDCPGPGGQGTLAYREAVVLINQGGPEVAGIGRWPTDARNALLSLVSSFVLANLRELQATRGKVMPQTYKEKVTVLRAGFLALKDSNSGNSVRRALVSCVEALVGPRFEDG